MSEKLNSGEQIQDNGELNEWEEMAKNAPEFRGMGEKVQQEYNEQGITPPSDWTPRMAATAVVELASDSDYEKLVDKVNAGDENAQKILGQYQTNRVETNAGPGIVPMGVTKAPEGRRLVYADDNNYVSPDEMLTPTSLPDETPTPTPDEVLPPESRANPNSRYEMIDHTHHSPEELAERFKNAEVEEYRQKAEKESGKRVEFSKKKRDGIFKSILRNR